MTRKACTDQIIEAAEQMIQELPIVSSLPLMKAQEFVSKIDDWMLFGDEVQNLLGAIEETEWSFFPEDEYGSSTATVSIESLLDVAKALTKVKSLENTND